MTETKQRRLTEWEQAVSDAVSPFGFTYYPNSDGGGYWWNKDEGLQLTYDLNPARWTLRMVEGLMLSTRWFNNQTRTPRTTATYISRMLAAVFAEPNWRQSGLWNRQNLGE
jgi:hypothetical protein